MSILLGAAMFAAMTSGQDITAQRVAPRGSYAQSCANAYTNQGRLYADCRDTRGQIRGSSIELTRCANEDVGNDNGLLVCGRHRGDYEDRNPNVPGRPGNGGNNGGGNNWGGNNGNNGGWGGNNGGWNGGRTPDGSYARSCTDISVRGNQLTATCRDTRRNERTSVLDISRCGRGDIANDNGLLICGTQRGQWVGNNNGGGWNGGNGGNNGGGWGGNNGGWGQSSITVYESADYRGDSREFTSEDTNLGRTPFNDRISSVRVQGRWEVCTDANFRGRCRIIDGDVRNLAPLGLDRNISSLRPVGRR